MLGKCVCRLVPLSQLQPLAALWTSGVRSSLSSAAPLSLCGLMPVVSVTELISFIFGLPFFLLPSAFPSLIVFSKKPCLLLTHPKWNSISVVFFASSYISGLICSRTHLVMFQVVQGVRRALLQHHISEESILFLSAFFTVQLLHLYIGIENTRVWMILALVWNNTSLLSMIFPNSFIAALPSFSLLLISWLQSAFEAVTEPR